MRKPALNAMLSFKLLSKGCAISQLILALYKMFTFFIKFLSLWFALSFAQRLRIYYEIIIDLKMKSKDYFGSIVVSKM